MRYVNPHPGQPVMYPQQQPMQPMQQIPQQQMMPTVVMTPQGPAMVGPQGLVSVQLQQTPQGPAMVTPQGMVLVQIQQMQQPQMQPMQPMMGGGGGVMAMHGGMQGQFPQQYVPQQSPQQFPNNPNQSVVQSRFGQPSSTMESTSIQSTDSGNRYASFQQPQQQQQPQQHQQVHHQGDEPTGPLLFTVTPVAHKFTGNDKFKMNVITEAIKANQVNYADGYLACDCLEEHVECVIEQAFKEEVTPLVTVRNYIINNNFWRVDLKDTVDLLVKSTIKEMYKSFKSVYGKLTDKHQVNVLNTINTMLTDAINDFLAVNSVSRISIESFYTDFNDLLKVVRSTEEDLEEDLLSYLNGYVGDMKLALNSTEKTPNATQVTEMVSVAYVDRHVLETGMEELDKNFAQVDDSIANAFVKSLAAEIIAKINKQEFLLVTLDKSIFKFMVSTSANVYVKKIA